MASFRTFSVEEYCAFPFSLASQATRCLGITIYLSTLDEPGWDKEFAKSQVDIVQFMDDMVERLEKVITTLNFHGGEDVFSRHGYFWKSIRPSILAKLGRQDSNMADVVAQAPDHANDGIETDLLKWDFFDNEWLSSMNWLGPGMQQQVL